MLLCPVSINTNSFSTVCLKILSDIWVGCGGGGGGGLQFYSFRKLLEFKTWGEGKTMQSFI